MTCEACGGATRIVFQQRGGALWCRGCSEAAKGVSHAHGIVTDEIPGGQMIENLGPTPIRVDTHAQRLAIAKRQGLREPTYADLPFSKSVTNWVTMDAYTLAAATALVSRPHAVAVDAEPDATVRVGFEHGEYTPADARAMIASLTS